VSGTRAECLPGDRTFQRHAADSFATRNLRDVIRVDARVTETIPGDYAALLTRPLYGHLGTIRPDDTVQVNHVV